jgi:hypothetical protein
MAAMLLAVVAYDEPCRLQGSRQPLVDFGRDRPGELAFHFPYIERLGQRAGAKIGECG